MPTSILIRQMNSLDERGSVSSNDTDSLGVAPGGNPTSLSRSPQSSIDSNTDVAQISMNWMRMNGLGQGAIRPLLTGNPVMVKSKAKPSHHLSILYFNGANRLLRDVDAISGFALPSQFIFNHIHIK
ncbi:hypothetical protein DICVIV_06370 [Dictyocaulus viviparus]|uniref:Uncharacterized protein n=1 Tax=Dictyocaulus viviparus TaxID=29172 RepID=A0A0D8XUU0_DICVI|nr:hypothetical protein DICVIV_06370 [Dictyocaulus viviparus]